MANSSRYRQSPRSEFAERARQAAEKAAALAPDHPDSYLAVGIYRFGVSRSNAGDGAVRDGAARRARQRSGPVDYSGS